MASRRARRALRRLLFVVPSASSPPTPNKAATVSNSRSLAPPNAAITPTLQSTAHPWTSQPDGADQSTVSLSRAADFNCDSDTEETGSIVPATRSSIMLAPPWRQSPDSWGFTGSGFQPAMVLAQVRPCAVSVMAGNNR